MDKGGVKLLISMERVNAELGKRKSWSAVNECSWFVDGNRVNVRGKRACGVVGVVGIDVGVVDINERSWNETDNDVGDDVERVVW